MEAPPTEQRRGALRGSLDCPKCVAEGRAGGFLSERAGAQGTFLVCSTGKDACGFLTDKPKNARQRKALQETTCPVCQGAMRLRLPQEKGKQPLLSCCDYPHCQGVRWFNGTGTLEEVQGCLRRGRPARSVGHRPSSVVRPSRARLLVLPALAQ